MRVSVLVGIAAIIVCASLTAHPRQVTSAHLNGQVYDSMGNPIAGATAKLILQTQEIRRASSDEQGGFEMSALAAGDYSLILESRGFSTRTVPVSLKEREIASLEVCLEVGINIEHPYAKHYLGGRKT